jgi:3-oxoacyl-[acyl-carrier-protein] synthase-3
MGGELLSRIVNWKDRNTCVLFGDGAGATIMKRSTKGRGILSAYMRSDGNLAELLMREKGGGLQPVNQQIIDEGSHMLSMKGREVFKYAVRSMADASDRALDGAKLSAADIDVMIPHQANIRIIEATAKHAGIPMEKVYVNVDRFGNTSAASIPIALSEAVREGRITDGTTVMFVAFGAGFTWGSMVVRF